MEVEIVEGKGAVLEVNVEHPEMRNAGRSMEASLYGRCKPCGLCDHPLNTR